MSENGSLRELLSDTRELPGGTETVLIAEDNPLVLNFSSSALTMLGYTVITASSGEEAVALAEKNRQKIDLFMTDVILPGMNGKLASEKISLIRPGIKALFNSGYTEKAIVTNGVLDQGLNFISKPFTAFELAHKIREVLDRKPLAGRSQ
jgi:two-component system, cell cycle sensor histidine kinase and response regulator CckA